MSSVWRVGSAAAVMGSAVWGVQRWAVVFSGPQGRLTQLALTVPVVVLGAWVYIGLVWLPRVAELSLVVDGARRVLGRLRSPSDEGAKVR